ncbi:hypothetical protein BJ508DRAFT_340163 [Ascobolus immersus RN42]|uniref:Uncharacterized protein n=1 Tax=Ascobolus immersus RN42 TaxID=1160509 RepID=A0A3N4HKW5_ASCIM|nr:hypothetical protein BJ508DRAFT_340163 [Ascobolus immersus RN42]
MTSKTSSDPMTWKFNSIFESLHTKVLTSLSTCTELLQIQDPASHRELGRAFVGLVNNWSVVHNFLSKAERNALQRKQDQPGRCTASREALTLTLDMLDSDVRWNRLRGNHANNASRRIDRVSELLRRRKQSGLLRATQGKLIALVLECWRVGFEAFLEHTELLAIQIDGRLYGTSYEATNSQATAASYRAFFEEIARLLCFLAALRSESIEERIWRHLQTGE